jgi:flavin reductase (DIM6/NTAB) family NADH-FMN oxidoreductase RutF/rubredoxin
MNKSAFYKLSYGVYVVSTLDAERATGCTANSAMQITSDPATIAISINHDNYTNHCIAATGKFALSILGEHTDPSVIGTFGFQSGKDHDKFAAVSHSMQSGMPVLMDACAYIVCDVIDTMETTTHTIFLGKVTDANVLKSDDPMTYAYYHNVIKGKSPKNAPTYIAEEETPAPKAAQYVCSVCGYVYDGAQDFETLPEDYRCPICKQPKSAFVKR